MKRAFGYLVVAFLFVGMVFSANGQKVTKTRSAKPERAQPQLTLSNAVAVSDGNGVFLRWSTADERNILGFFVYRATGNGLELIESNMIPGGYLRSRLADNENGEYSFFDPVGRPDDVYTLETLGTGGKRERFGPFETNLLTDISVIAGSTSAELAESLAKKPVVELFRNQIPSDLMKPFGEFVLPPDPTQQQWVAAQPGVKMQVKTKGIYRVTRAQLQAAGFDLNAPSSNWQLYVDGREQGMIVGAGDSYIEFYGDGMDTFESDTRAYYLVNGPVAGKRTGSRVMRTINSTVMSNGFAQTFEKRERVQYFSGMLNGDDQNFFGAIPIGGTSTYSYNLNIPAIDYLVPRSTVRVKLQGLTVNPHNVQITINGQVMPANVIFQGQDSGVGTYEIDTALLVEGANTIQMRAFAGANDFTVIDSISIDYSRRFVADQNQLSFFTVNYKSARLSGFTSADVRVFDLTNPDNPDEVLGLSATGNGPTFDLNIPANRARVLYAVEASAVRSPVSIVQQFPSALRTPLPGAEMVIITHRDWFAQAQTWANYRSGQGTSVAVVDIADIFDEFSFGSQNSVAITQLLQYAKQSWGIGPNYVMFLGDATYDLKNYGNATFNSFVPTKLVDTLYEETGSDEAMSDFNNDGLTELGVGRIPVRSGAEATQVLAKITAFESTLTNVLDRGATFVADQPIGYDFEGVNNRVSMQLPPSMPKMFISRVNPEARNLLLPELNRGPFIVNYSGHGSTLFWAVGGFFHRNDLPNLTNQGNLTIFTLLTCLNGYFVPPTFDSFAETAIKTPNGGAVVAWASSGKTTPDVQEIMATRFYNQIGLGTIPKIGDLVRDAKQSLVGGRDVRLSWTLFGDPAMKVR